MSHLTVSEILNKDREQLLDIGNRNRLISTPRKQKRAKQIEIVHERSSDIFDLLVIQKKAMTFLPLGDDKEEEEDAVDSRKEQLLAFMAAESEDDSPGHFLDTKLQTDLPPKKLQGRLRDLQTDSRTFVEEQGVSPLYLALGFLKWRESDSSDRDRFAPLILIPIEITRNDVNSSFKLTFSEEELSTNLSLQLKLKSEFGVVLPELPELEDLNVEEYFDFVSRAIESKANWEVLRNDIQLNFFQFAKFLMYRDLDPQSWPASEGLNDKDVLSNLLVDEFPQSEETFHNDDRIDEYLPARNMIHVVDADSSQMEAIEEIRKGKNLVIQGPPGTGKSQTITNLIATAVKEGKRVLFLSEKMAALNVVKSRLESIGLGQICLELHSNKSRKKTVLEELSRTLRLRSSKPVADHLVHDSVDQLRKQLNKTADALHSPFRNSGKTPFSVMGRLVYLHEEIGAQSVQQRTLQFDGATEWDESKFKELKIQLESLIDLVEQTGAPHEHSFRNTRCSTLIRTDQEALQTAIQNCLDTVSKLLELGLRLSRLLKISANEEEFDLSSLGSLTTIADCLSRAPDLDREAIASDHWQTRFKTIQEVVELGEQSLEAKICLDGKLNDGVMDVKIDETRRHLNAYGRQFFLFRIFNKKYREAQNTLREILRSAPPTDLESQLKIIDDLLALQNFERTLNGDVTILQVCQEAFGTLWKSESSDWGKLREILDWIQNCAQQNVHKKFRLIYSKLKTESSVLEHYVNEISRLTPEFNHQIKQVEDLLAFDCQTHFGTDAMASLPLQLTMQWLENLDSNFDSLPNWIRYRLKRELLIEEGLAPVVTLIDHGEIDPDFAVNLFELKYLEQILRVMYSESPELAEFSGLGHETIRQRFREADHKMIETNRDDVAGFHLANIPSGNLGGMKTVRHEIQKKSRHLAIRRLIKEAGPAIQRIKPVFMMSPLSVAQYLEPGAVEFDLLLIDEASQVEPVDALGAAARCKQMVVVGDDKQLPPTRFFSRSAEVDEKDESQSARDLESILGLCLARGMRQKMLRWHYRSQHQSLIAVSNSEYYGNDLYVVPSPIRDSNEHGVHFEFVEDGAYDRGGKSDNPIEARRVAEAIINHAQTTPDLSLGVAAFSVSQRDAILDELELLERDNPETFSFFQSSGSEPFFVKNLENVQGDERDVIFISVGYGKDKDGYMTQSYGPLNREGGERRLNVLISRAKQKCVVFSSITANDIDLHKAHARGVVGLKKYLQFAENGYSDVGEITGRGFDSDFEREVANQIANYGYDVECQVGIAGFFIDLAIVDAQQPGRYLIGIECDGAAYHSSRSARDRDRLREEVLKARGWRIHRIWSTDWYQNPEVELRKVISQIEAVRTSSEEILDSGGNQRELATANVQEVEEVEDATQTGHGFQVEPYREASFEIIALNPLPEMHSDTIDKYCLKVLRLESPIHSAELARRLASLTNSKAGKRVVRSVEESVLRLQRRGEVQYIGDFIETVPLQEVVVRDRSSVTSSGLKKAENIPESEIGLAIVLLLHENGNAEKEELLKAAASVFGIKRLTVKVQSHFDSVLENLVAREAVESSDSVLSIKNWESCEKIFRMTTSEGQLL
ncbi:DUF4011 domain-containing protein [Thalassoglobus sp.]|uniref:DUF4011 domain-containing protein n=1 Tax=Thalassoglobus sp. TaxID=2795869 RepID=UPI003AA8052D